MRREVYRNHVTNKELDVNGAFHIMLFTLDKMRIAQWSLLFPGISYFCIDIHLEKRSITNVASRQGK